MKPMLLKTLAAASLVATAHAEVHVMGAVWKERGINAPLGEIIPNPGTVAATRGYLIMDDSIFTETPVPATFIQYGEIREAGVITRYYTINSDFDAFRADAILGDSGGRRLYGHMYAPVQIAEVSDVTTPFTGTVTGGDFAFPKKMSFDTTVFQTGGSTLVTGPRILTGETPTFRSVISGSANPVNVSATTIEGATAELQTRLTNAGYSRGAVAPVIATDLLAAIARDGYKTETLSVTLGDDVYPVPSYQWRKDDAGGIAVAIPGANGDTYVVPAGTPGNGTYSVVITNDAGSAVSGKTVVTTNNVPMSITTNLPATVNLTFGATRTLGVVINANAFPQPATYQWAKGTSAAGPFTNIPVGNGGLNATYTVIGDAAAINGPGFYRLTINNGAGQTLDSAVTQVSVVVGP